MSRCALKGYRAIQAAGKIEGATPHRLTALLFEAALTSIQTARRIDDGQVRYRSIDRALAIVGELQGSLRDPDGEELSGRLFSLYGFVTAQLLESTADGDPDKLRLARDVLVPIAGAWAAIAPTRGSVDGVAPRHAA